MREVNEFHGRFAKLEPTSRGLYSAHAEDREPDSLGRAQAAPLRATAGTEAPAWDGQGGSPAPDVGWFMVSCALLLTAIAIWMVPEIEEE